MISRDNAYRVSITPPYFFSAGFFGATACIPISNDYEKEKVGKYEWDGSFCTDFRPYT